MTIQSESPMRNFERNVKLEAHYAAQQVIANQVENDWRDYGRKLNEFQIRKAILDQLEAFGYARFIISRSSKGELLELDCSRVFHNEYDDGCGSSQHLFWNASEVRAYLDYIGDTDSVIDYMREEYAYEGYSSGPGRGFSSGQTVNQKGSRIVAYSFTGLDV